jgi:predicted RNA methylase
MTERLKKAISLLNSGETVYCDWLDTLFIDNEPNIPLISALIEAQERGVRVCLWTDTDFFNAISRVQYCQIYNLYFDDVYCNVHKPELIIDDLAMNPKH